MKSILVCVDGSDYSLSSMEHAIAIAKPRGAHVDVLYATDMRVFEMSIVSGFGSNVGSHPYTGIMEQMQMAEHLKAEIIKKVAKRVFEKNGYLEHMDFHHLSGFLLDLIEEFEANDRGVDLIILGKRGEHFQNFKGYLGSTTERILKSSGTPCLIATEKYSNPKEILLAYDGSVHSRAVVRGMLRCNDIFQGRLHIVTVDSSDNDEAAKEQLSEIKNLFKETSFKISTAVLCGEVDDAIVKYAKNHSIDMLTMGAFGRSGIRHLIAGSTTTKLLTGTNVTTLVYRGDK